MRYSLCVIALSLLIAGAIVVIVSADFSKGLVLIALGWICARIAEMIYGK